MKKIKNIYANEPISTAANGHNLLPDNRDAVDNNKPIPGQKRQWNLILRTSMALAIKSRVPRVFRLWGR